MRSGGDAVRARGLVKRYGALVAVDGVDLAVAQGTCTGLLGPNGAGKTTTVEILEGLKAPDAGEVEILGLRWDEDERGIRERMGVQLQETTFSDKVTCREVLRLFRSFFRAGLDVEEVLEQVGLTEKRDVRTSALSGGQRQRLALGCALINRPQVLFLDEPTTGLDPQARRHMWEVIEDFKREGGSVLLTTHYMEEAERLADDLVVVDRGKVIARGSPAALVAALQAESVVELLADEATAESLRAAGATLPGVREARVEGAGLRLAVEDTQAAVGALFGLLAARGVALSDLRLHRPTLEDVFVALTGKHLREGA